MAAGSTARTTHFPCVHYARAEFTFADEDKTYTLVTLPAGALILDAGVYVATAFNSAGGDSNSDTLILGYAADDDEYLSAVDLQSVGRKFDASDLTASVELNPQSDRAITFKYANTHTGAGAATATAGRAIVWLTYIPDTQGLG